MKLTLKIAAGVFLGAMAVLAVLHIPTWQKEAWERQANHAMYKLTPEALIARCGKPLKDVDTTVVSTLPSRSMSYKETAFEYKLTFLKVDGEWNLAVMDDDLGLRNYFSAVDRIAALPCLKGK